MPNPSSNSDFLDSVAVAIGADSSEFEAAINALPRKAREAFDEVTSNISKQLADNDARLESLLHKRRVAYDIGDAAGFSRYTDAIRDIEAESHRLEAVLQQTAQAALNMGRSAQLGAVNAANASRAQAAAVQDVYTATINASAAATRYAASLRGAGSSSGNAAQALLLLGQTIDDAQYGFRAIVNNIPQVSMALGQAAGLSSESATKLGGALAIAGVAINTWINNWESLVDLLGDKSQAPFKTGIALIDDMRRALEYATAQSERLAKAEKDRKAALESVSGIKSTADQDRGKKVGAAVEAFGGNKVLDKLTEGAIANTGGEDALRKRVRTQAEREITHARESNREDLNKIPISPGTGLGDVYNSLLPKIDLNDETNKRLKIEKERIRGELSKLIKSALSGDQGAIDQVIKTLGPNSEIGSRLKRELTRDDKGDEAAIEKRNKEREEADKDKKKQADDYEKGQDKFAGEAAKALSDRIGRGLLANPDERAGRAAAERDVRESLKRAGGSKEEVDDLVPRIVRKIGDELRETLNRRVLEKNVTPDQARAQLLKESQDRAKEEAEKRVKDEMEQRGKSESIGSGRDLSLRLIQAALDSGGKNDAQERAARAAEQNTAELRGLNQRTDRVIGRLERLRGGYG
jgi:hypothetical protein